MLVCMPQFCPTSSPRDTVGSVAKIFIYSVLGYSLYLTTIESALWGKSDLSDLVNLYLNVLYIAIRAVSGLKLEHLV